MAVTLKRSLHIDEIDISLLDIKTKESLLKHKMILRADNSDEGSSEIEEVFIWVAENCQQHYMVRGPETDADTIKYYIYFVDEHEAAQFKLTFPQ